MTAGGQKNGHTLFEVILVIIILGIISAITFQFFTGSVRLYRLASSYSRIYQFGRNALARICRDTRSAEEARTRTMGSDGRLQLGEIQTTPLDDATEITYSSDVGGTGLLVRSRTNGTSPSDNPIAAELSRWGPSSPLTDYFIRMEMELLLPEGGTVEFRTGAALRNREDNYRPPRRWRETVD